MLLGVPTANIGVPLRGVSVFHHIPFPFAHFCLVFIFFFLLFLCKRGMFLRCFLHFFLVLRPKRSFFCTFLCRFSEHRGVFRNTAACRNTGKKKFGKKKKTRVIISDDQGHYVFLLFSQAKRFCLFENKSVCPLTFPLFHFDNINY